MEKIIVYLDDAVHAQRQFASMTRPRTGPLEPTHWVLVACAPRVTHRISKWASHRSRENWREKWADKLFEQVVPSLRSNGDAVTTVLAREPLPELTRSLLSLHGEARVVDARRPKAATEPPQPASRGKWDIPGALVGMGTVLLLAAD
jgi:hypothetical protein